MTKNNRPKPKQEREMKTFKELREGASVEKPKLAEPTANHPANVTPPKQGSSDDSARQFADHHMCASKVVHPKYGTGKPLVGEHAVPNKDGDVAWYRIMFEHGVEMCETYALEVIAEGPHANHYSKKKN
jgi:hypothetical protein